jgi:hypothetical protein
LPNPEAWKIDADARLGDFVAGEFAGDKEEFETKPGKR